jgi:histidinol-phosphate/aromatic aminotransferase/cobyric acid decarboxylase-like protein
MKMEETGKSARGLECRAATDADRSQIDALRHEVYARELGQHAVNAGGRIEDPLDATNIYRVVADGPRVIGFISVTAPESPSYSIDKYFRRDELPFVFDDGLFEIRTLTVDPLRRGHVAFQLLLYASLRCVEERGGRRIVAIGREDLVPFYERYGLAPLGLRTRAGQVSYELMEAPVARIARIARSRHRAVLERALRSIEWKAPEPLALDDACFHGGASVSAVPLAESTAASREGIVAADVLDAWFPPAPGVVRALEDEAEWLARAAPPSTAAPLRGALARTSGLDESSVVIGAGSSDLIFRAFTHWLSPASRALVPDPTYGEYAHVLERVVGCRLERFPLRREDDFSLDLDAWTERLHRGDIDLAVLVNPNNPTGTYIPRDELLAALSRIPPTTRVWIDEAYAAYVAEEISVARQAAGNASLYVCRSMSKAFALSGLRVASLVAHPCRARALRRLTPPWVVSLPAQVAALHALADLPYYRARYDETAGLRAELARKLRALGLEVREGDIPSLMVDLPGGPLDAAALVHAARQQGVFLRDLTGLSAAFFGHTVRVAVRSAVENERLCSVLSRVVSGAS